MPSKKKRKIPYLALLGLLLGFIYFTSGKISGKKVKKQLDNISESASEIKNADEALNEDLVDIKDHLQNESISNEQNFQDIQNSQGIIIEKIDDLSEEDRNGLEEYKRKHLERWTDDKGESIIDPGISPEMKSFLENAQGDRTVDLKKKGSSYRIKLDSNNNPIKNKPSKLDTNFHLSRWVNHNR